MFLYLPRFQKLKFHFHKKINYVYCVEQLQVEFSSLRYSLWIKSAIENAKISINSKPKQTRTNVFLAVLNVYLIRTSLYILKTIKKTWIPNKNHSIHVLILIKQNKIPIATKGKQKTISTKYQHSSFIKNY
jgi:hypothetical protein